MGKYHIFTDDYLRIGLDGYGMISYIGTADTMEGAWALYCQKRQDVNTTAQLAVLVNGALTFFGLSETKLEFPEKGPAWPLRKGLKAVQRLGWDVDDGGFVEMERHRLICKAVEKVEWVKDDTAEG